MDAQLVRDVAAATDEIPIIDLYSRISPDSPAAADASEVVLCDDVLDELKTANVPSEFFELSGRKMLQEASQHFERIGNTSTIWQLRRILRDLYGKDELTQASLDELSQSTVRPAEVVSSGRLERVLFRCDWRREVPSADPPLAPILDINSLINEPHVLKNQDALSEVTGITISEASDLRKAIVDLMRKAREAGALGACVQLEPNIDFEDSSRESADRILSLVLLGQKPNRDDRRALRSFVMDLVLQSCREHRMPIQIHLGRRYVRSAEQHIAAYDPAMPAMYAELFNRHPGTKFDIVLTSATFGHEFSAMCRSYRNVFLSGFGCFAAFPTAIRQALRERIEMIPLTKCSALTSGAANLEWVYGKSCLVRHELALALSEMIDEGYLAQPDAPRAAQAFLLDNPKRIYKIE